MSRRTRDDEVARVAADLDGLLDDLAANIAALNAILTPSAPPAQGPADERLAAP
jgi:hypothetical protein